MKELNFFSYELEMTSIAEGRNEEGDFVGEQDTWNKESFVNWLNRINEAPNAKKVWKFHPKFMALDKVAHYGEDNKIIEELDGDNILFSICRLKYGTIEDISNYMNFNDLEDRPSERKLSEAESKYLYFYVRYSDGLLLLQGSTLITPKKFTEYLIEVKNLLHLDREITSIRASNIFDNDFFNKLNKASTIRSLELEIKNEEINNHENKLLNQMSQGATNLKSNYFSLKWDVKYIKGGLNGVGNFIRNNFSQGKIFPESIKKVKVVGTGASDEELSFTLKKATEKNKIKLVDVADILTVETRVEFEKLLYTELLLRGERRVKLER
ncbi:hypothetical protein [Listeria grandensis]|uniref:hypothetical protein n=1 Tax=Listeria grandensis TaxID=1494963 RepID=UPI00164E7A1C|nr:hypothetical protein [Listeria grandensis]MBC6315402.1 hypothetical protein [Listeria grandensis]